MKKQVVGTWKCKNCLLDNDISYVNCKVCNVPAPPKVNSNLVKANSNSIMTTTTAKRSQSVDTFMQIYKSEKCKDCNKGNVKDAVCLPSCTYQIKKLIKENQSLYKSLCDKYGLSGNSLTSTTLATTISTVSLPDGNTTKSVFKNAKLTATSFATTSVKPMFSTTVISTSATSKFGSTATTATATSVFDTTVPTMSSSVQGSFDTCAANTKPVFDFTATTTTTTSVFSSVLTTTPSAVWGSQSNPVNVTTALSFWDPSRSSPLQTSASSLQSAPTTTSTISLPGGNTSATKSVFENAGTTVTSVFDSTIETATTSDSTFCTSIMNREKKSTFDTIFAKPVFGATAVNTLTTSKFDSTATTTTATSLLDTTIPIISSSVWGSLQNHVDVTTTMPFRNSTSSIISNNSNNILFDKQTDIKPMDISTTFKIDAITSQSGPNMNSLLTSTPTMPLFQNAFISSSKPWFSANRFEQSTDIPNSHLPNKVTTISNKALDAVNVLPTKNLLIFSNCTQGLTFASTMLDNSTIALLANPMTSTNTTTTTVWSAGTTIPTSILSADTAIIPNILCPTFEKSSGFSTETTSPSMNKTIVKFHPTTDIDSLTFMNGSTITIAVRYQCITLMGKYQSISLEELRLEDYVLRSKNTSQGFGVRDVTQFINKTTVKFQPVICTARYMCITCMNEYESVSLEELRLENYLLGCKTFSNGRKEKSAFDTTSRITTTATKESLTLPSKPLFGDSSSSTNEDTANESKIGDDSKFWFSDNSLSFSDCAQRSTFDTATNVNTSVTNTVSTETISTLATSANPITPTATTTTTVTPFDAGSSILVTATPSATISASSKLVPIPDKNPITPAAITTTTVTPFDAGSSTLVTATPSATTSAPSKLVPIPDKKSGTGTKSLIPPVNKTIVKYLPVIGTDFTLLNGEVKSIVVQYMCITLMKEYKSVSLEELRFENYLLGYKGIIQDTK